MSKKNIYLHLLRKNILIVITLALYILSIYYFFFDVRILWWLFFSIQFFLFAPYFMIELKNSQSEGVLFIVLISCVFLIILKWFWNIFYSFWIVLFNLAIFFLFLDIWNEVYNRIRISPYKVFTMWIWTFSLFLASTFALSFMWTYRTFDLTCDKIFQQLSNLSQYTLKYFGFSSDPSHIQQAKLKDIAEYIWWPQANLSWSNLTWNLSLPATNALTWIVTSWAIASGNTAVVTETDKTSNGDFKWIDHLTFESVINIDFRKWIILNQIMENRQLLNENMCELVVSNIKSKYQNSEFQITVLFMMFILFYPFIRIFLFIISIVNLVFFGIMMSLKIYRYRTVSEDVYIIE